MKKLTTMILVIVLVASSAFGQNDQIRKKPSGPRRQLATIVFAGLGGAILGLSTLSFYGRPQDQLGNIFIGFAVGVIVGTCYVTFRSATTREYFEEPPADPNRGVLIKTKDLDSTAKFEEPKFLWGPMVQRSTPQSEPVLGAQAAFRF